MSTLNIVRLYRLYDRVRESSRSVDAIRVAPLTAGKPTYCFNRKSLYSRRGKVASLLSQLPDDMMQSHSDTFVPWIQARFNWHLTQWATQLSDVDLLLAMGRALQMVHVHILDYPCVFPYVQVLNVDASTRERLTVSSHSRLSRWDFAYLRTG